MIKYCKCGCGAIVKNKYVKGHYTKNKTYIEIYGEKKAKQLIDNLKQNKDKSYEEIHGEEKAKLIRKKMSLKHKGNNKGKTLEEMHGEEKAKQLKMVRRKIKSVKQVVDVLQEVFRYKGNIMKMEFFDNKIVKEKLGTMNTIRDTLKKYGKSIDDIAVQANVQFKKQTERFGTNEKEILDDVEVEKSVHLKRQFFVINFHIDGYDRDNNIAYEVDEPYHKHQQPQDIIRENKIKSVIPNITFIKIKDRW